MKIIAIDNEKKELNSLLLAIKLASPNAEVNGFNCFDDAIKHMKTALCDVAFIEPCSDTENGIKLVEDIIKINPNINIIFATKDENYRADAFRIHASGYLMKPIGVADLKKELSDLRRPVASQKLLKVRAFGNFEVLFCDTPLVFKYQKSKELLAYLVDRRGAMCSTGELTSILFEDSKDHKAYYHRLRADLLDTLSRYGCKDAISQRRGLLGVVVGKLDCDYYDYIDGKTELSKLYCGEYMAQYSFAEITNAELFARLKKNK